MSELRKAIPLPSSTVNLTEDEVGALRNECDAALHEWDEEKAQTLFHQVEAESSDVRIGKGL